VRAATYTEETPSGPHIEITVDAARVPPDAGGIADREYDPLGYIIGGTIVYKEVRNLAFAAATAHELGHFVGLEHSTQEGIMSAAVYSYYSRYKAFSPTEQLVINLLYQRPVLNSFPDNDRIGRPFFSRQGGFVGPFVKTIVCSF